MITKGEGKENSVPKVSLPITLINDGRLSRQALKEAGKDMIWLRDTLGRHRARQDTTLLLTVDEEEHVVWIGKEE